MVVNEIGGQFGVQGWSYGGGNCSLYKTVTGNVTAANYTSQIGKPPSHPVGKCQAWSSITGTAHQPLSVSSKVDQPNASVVLWPSWPASSPWVTSVGATRFIDQKVGNPEMASDQFGSGGGFSRMFDAYQTQAEDASNYLNNAPQLPPAGSFPPSGRATPDVSALGEGFEVVASGKVSPVGGTSASTPLFAGLVSLLNEARLDAGKPPMGYLNIWIFQNPSMFTDVTVGTNAIGRGTGPIPYGFNCTKGWDPATGLGTPIFGKMLKSALN